MRRMHPAGGFVAPSIRVALARAATHGAAALILAAPAVRAQVPDLPADLPLELESWDVLDETIAVQSPIHVALAPDGGLYVADFHTADLVRLAPDGTRLWRTGGKGEGPGEFGMLYRLGVRPDGTLLAYDMSAGTISFFAPDGAFIERRRLNIGFRQVDALASPDEETILIAGIVSRRTHPDIFPHGIHRFDAELKHVVSFGPVPPAVDKQKLEFWGAGDMRRTSDGLLLYAIRQPYDLYWFEPDGTKRRQVIVDLPLKGTVDESFEITRGDGWRIRDTEEIVTRPGLPQEIGHDRLLGIRYEGDVRHWDVLTENGDVVATAEVPRSLGSAAAVVPDRRVMWLIATVALEPRVVRATYRMRE